MKPSFSAHSMLTILFSICISGWTQLLSAEIPGNINPDPPCPGGKDTTYIICPHYDHFNNLLFHTDLPQTGVWDPPLQDTFGTIYNSCVDGQSMYIYPHEYPGCPTVMDTARFQLTWDPCGWALENVCYTTDSILFTIPAYPGTPGSALYWIDWHFPGRTFSLDSAYHLSIHNPGSSNHYDLHIFLESTPFCWWTFGELLAWDFYGAQAEHPCDVTGLGITPITQSTILYPVPVENVLYIETDKSVIKILIHGLDGRLYKEINHPDALQINVADIGPGYYIIRLFDGQRWHSNPMVKP